MNHILAWILTASGVGVFAFINRDKLKILKSIFVISRVLDLLRDAVEASSDNQITPEEVQKFRDEIKAIEGELGLGNSPAVNNLISQKKEN